MPNLWDAFWTRPRRTRQADQVDQVDQAPAGEKALTITQEPGGFVTEIRGLSGRRLDASTSALQEAQRANELVYACLDVKATAAIDPRLIVEQRINRDGRAVYEEQTGHPMRQLMMRPNPHMTEADLMRAAIVSWDVSNPRRFYCEKVYSDRGLLVELWPLNPACMTPRRNQAGELVGYTWRDGNDARDYTLDELLIRSAPAWYDPPPLVAARGSTASDTAQTSYVHSFFVNGGVPPGLLKYNMPLLQGQRDEIREKWREQYSIGTGGAHGVGVLDVNATWEKTGANLDELASQQLRSVAESRICMVFKVPPLIVYAYVGLMRATYSNLKEAWASFWDATMSPAFKEWRVFWQWSLLPEFEEERDILAENVRLAYDLSAVAALQDDVDAAHARAEKIFRAGGATLNEYRARVGLPEDPAGDYYLRAAGVIPEPAGGAGGARARSTRRPARGRKDKDSPSNQVITRRAEQSMAGYLAEQYRTAAAAAAASGDVDEGALDDGIKAISLMRRPHEQWAENAWRDAGDLLDVDTVYSVENEHVAGVLDRLADQVRNVAETTKQDIRDIIARGAADGLSNEEIGRAIREKGDITSRPRALRIARTEGATAYNLGSLAAYRDAGITHVDVLDGDDDEPCASANGARWTLDQAEENPLGHPNCTRAFTAVVNTEE